MAISVTDMSGLDEPAAIRVLIVDDHALMRAGITRLLEQSSDIVVVGEASDGEEALRAVEELRPDLVLMDLSTSRLDRSAATRRIHEAHPDLRIVVLSSYVDRTGVLDAVDAGAVAYLLKDARPEDLLRGIRSALGGGSPLAPQAAREVLIAWRGMYEPGELTSRELDALVLLAEGLPNKVIAQRLGIAEKTVKAHVTRVFRALGVTDRTQAALWVERRGLTLRQQRRRDELRAPAQTDAAAGATDIRSKSGDDLSRSIARESTGRGRRRAPGK
jgi:DNA-binding NarL/FixJ family response regulator